jgi:hypothetical protein
MRDSVSIRNITAQPMRSATSLRKSEASPAGDVARFLPLWPQELSDRSFEGRKKLIAVVERALREERRRGRAGDWAYDLTRHAALYRMLKQERAELAAWVRGRGTGYCATNDDAR